MSPTIKARVYYGYVRPWRIRRYPLQLDNPRIRRGWLRYLIVQEVTFGDEISGWRRQGVIGRVWTKRRALRVVNALRGAGA